MHLFFASPIQMVSVRQVDLLLDIVHRELRVQCLPADIPEHIDVEVTDLKIGDFVRVKDLKISDKIKILNDPETVVIAVEHPRAEEEPVAAAATEVEAEPEVIKKGKAASPEAEGEEAEAAEKPEKAEKAEKKK